MRIPSSADVVLKAIWQLTGFLRRTSHLHPTKDASVASSDSTSGCDGGIAVLSLLGWSGSRTLKKKFLREFAVFFFQNLPQLVFLGACGVLRRANVFS